MVLILTVYVEIGPERKDYGVNPNGMHRNKSRA